VRGDTNSRVAMSLLASPSLTSRTTSRQVGVSEAQPGKGGPTQGDVLLGNANVELFLNVAATSVAAAILGLALSALAPIQRADDAVARGVDHFAARVLRRHDPRGAPARARPTVLVHTGPVGFAASASTVDLTKLVPRPLAHQRFVLEPHSEGVDLRRRHACRAVYRLRHVCPLEDPAQGRVGPASIRGR
jgi:hypothetical protein